MTESEQSTLLDLGRFVMGLNILIGADPKARYQIVDDCFMVKTKISPNDINLYDFGTLGELGFIYESWDGSWVVYG